MPRKRKTKKSEPAITVKKMVAANEPPTRLIKCVWDSRLIIGGDKTPSGTRYEFEPDQTKLVSAIDHQFLLDMRAKAPGCCGGGGGSSMNIQKYFEAIEVLEWH